MQDLIFKKVESNKKYDDFVMENGYFTQSTFYANWQEKLNRKVHRFTIEDSAGETFLYVQFIEISGGLGQKYLYAPYGPVYKKISPEVLNLFKKEIKKFTKENKAIFSRLDFQPAISADLLIKHFHKASKESYKGVMFQPRDEWVLDLDIDEESLLQNIHKKNRYAIRQAEKNNVEIEFVEENINRYFEEFYNLMKETSDRNKFHIHSKSYYKTVFDSIDQNKNGYLVITKINIDGKSEIDNILLFLTFGNTVTYLFGGSSNKFRKIPSAHLAQWKNFLYAKGRGIVHYNFGGISTEKNPSESLVDLTRFKTRFGGYILEHSDFYDVIGNKILYKLFNIRKKLS